MWVDTRTGEQITSRVTKMSSDSILLSGEQQYFSRELKPFYWILLTSSRMNLAYFYEIGSTYDWSGGQTQAAVFVGTTFNATESWPLFSGAFCIPPSLSRSGLLCGGREVRDVEDLFVWPNPASEVLHVQIPRGTLFVTLTSVHGVASREWVQEGAQTFDIPLRQLTSGMYTLTTIGATTQSKLVSVIR